MRWWTYFVWRLGQHENETNGIDALNRVQQVVGGVQ